jgi:hypothetical protein
MIKSRDHHPVGEDDCIAKDGKGSLDLNVNQSYLLRQNHGINDSITTHEPCNIL